MAEPTHMKCAGTWIWLSFWKDLKLREPAPIEISLALDLQLQVLRFKGREAKLKQVTDTTIVIGTDRQFWGQMDRVTGETDIYLDMDEQFHLVCQPAKPLF